MVYYKSLKIKQLTEMMNATLLESSMNESQRRGFCLSVNRQIGSHVMEAQPQKTRGQPQSTWLTLAVGREKDQIRRTDCADGLYLLCHSPPGWCSRAPPQRAPVPLFFYVRSRSVTPARLICSAATVMNLVWKPRAGLWCLDGRSKVKSVAHPLRINHSNAAWSPVRLRPSLYLSIFIPAVTRLVRFDSYEC